MGAFSPYERAYRLYMNDRKNGNSSAKDMIRAWIRDATRQLGTGVILGIISVYLMSLLLSGDESWWKAIPFLILIQTCLGSVSLCIFGVFSLIEDSVLLNHYRQIKYGHEEKKNE
jgi:predicted membrane protein